eukprot:364562-Chlamydomonas_euryale.AAC.11
MAYGKPGCPCDFGTGISPVSTALALGWHIVSSRVRRGASADDAPETGGQVPELHRFLPISLLHASLTRPAMQPCELGGELPQADPHSSADPCL